MEDAKAYKDGGGPKLLSKIHQMIECGKKYKNYNFKCFPWYIGGKDIRGMYLSYPGFNGDN